MKNTLVKKILAVTLALGLTVTTGIFALAEEFENQDEFGNQENGDFTPSEDYGQQNVYETEEQPLDRLTYYLDYCVADKSVRVNQYNVTPGKVYLMYCPGRFLERTILLEVERVFEDPMSLMGYEFRTNRTVVGTDLLTGEIVKQSISGAGGAFNTATLFEVKPVADRSTTLILRDQLNMY